ncbi:VCBS repeat-containing protein [Ramlibacter ginsenosidimutans]|uniref:VCBS repeat-containing protein n=1 Tax=Ramlibacter ginsenosidimutans TaxID=502333 RepID=A0A934WN43_9BURK|nr:VCBS repeat-containing protein [Ramlibacter ginsenosidimutans]
MVEVGSGSQFIPSKLYVYFQQADGSYVRSSEFAQGPILVAATGDVNGDGRTDLLLHDFSGSSKVMIYLARSDFTFDPPQSVQLLTGAFPALWIGDFNGDGWTDLVTLHMDATAFFGSRTGAFTRVMPTLPYAYQGRTVAVGDLDGDGVKDLLAIGPNSPSWTLSIALGAGAADYSNVANWLKPMTSGWSSEPIAHLADVNGDGRLDLLYVTGGRTFATLLSTAPGKFDGDPTYSSMDAPFDYAFSDIDGDGRVDAVGGSFISPVQIRRGDGAGGWSLPFYSLPALATPTGWTVKALVGDKDGQGNATLLVSNSGKLSVLTPR